ncbi:MAG: Xaa-Pro peptidase family protein [Planctomycetota bacterium]
MLSDIDILMQQQNINCLVLSGTPKECKDMFYLTGPVAITGGMVIKKLGSKPFIICGAMEREEASKNGMDYYTFTELGLGDIYKTVKNPLKASVKFFKNIMKRFDIKGCVAFCGKGDITHNYLYISELIKSGVLVALETEDPIFSEARITKDDTEIRRIESVGKKAQEIMKNVVKFMKRQRSSNGKLVTKKGVPVKIGDVKKFIESEAQRLDVCIEQPLIFSHGRDSAIPHSRGDNDADILLGKTIVFDFCPYEPGGGYFFDITRTFCLGYVPDKVQKIYNHVLTIQKKILKRLRVGVAGSDYDDEVNKFFQKHGYSTLDKDNKITSGYVHSLGHGIGLNIHERPRLSSSVKNKDILDKGHVFTIEPGLYFPEEEIGVRIEDVVAFKNDGTIVNLTADMPKKLFVPVKEL